jgi:quercetin dioxygenase-like cupin family protein
MTSLPRDEPPARPVGHEQLAGKLDAPLLGFDLTKEIKHLQQQPAWREGRGPSSTTLVKHADLRLVLVAMRAGERMAQHRTEARISIHTLRGRIRLALKGQSAELGPLQLLVLEREIVHDVEALEDSAFLLTLAWPGDDERGDTAR